jgi:hypothetical protein
MSWRSSFGATVLLTLVALHSSATPLRSMLEEMLGSVEVVAGTKTLETMERYFSSEMRSVWSDDRTKCSEKFFQMMRTWRYLVKHNSHVGIVDKALERWRDTCYSRLEGEIRSELQTMSESAREQFKLFVKQDERDLESKDESLAISFHSENSAIAKLHRLIGSPDGAASTDQLNAAKTFVGACNELTASRSIMRANYARKTPASQRPYFPHIRFYDDCRLLLDFFLGERDIDYLLKRARWVETFGDKLDKILVKGWRSADPEAKWSETAKSDGKRERLVAEAAYLLAKSCIGTIDYWLKFTKDRCSEAFADVNTIWLHLRLHLLRRKLSNQQILVIKRYSRYLEACKQLGKLENEQIIKKATDKQGYKLSKLSTRFGGSNAKTNR